MSNETTEFWKAQRRVTRKERATRRGFAAIDFEEARLAANKCGMVLTKCSESHYQLRGGVRGDWLINLHPGNGRVWHDRNRPKPPRLELSSDWGLMDAVKAAATAPF